mgnify:CR=1 FL=1|tara:strand:- start:2176 stop:2889 length:714 start_codon:yes stop_codon:yes gene_type:complete
MPHAGQEIMDSSLDGMSDTGILQEDGEPLELPKTGTSVVPPTKGMFSAKEAKQAATETGLVAVKKKKYGDLKKLGDFIEKEGVVKTSIGYVFLSAEKLEPLMQLAADIAYEADDDTVKLQAISKAVEVSKQLTESAKICGNMVNNKQLKSEEAKKKASFAPGQQITPIQINDPKQVNISGGTPDSGSGEGSDKNNAGETPAETEHSVSGDDTVAGAWTEDQHGEEGLEGEDREHNPV